LKKVKLRKCYINTANYARLETDKFFTNYNNQYKYDGFINYAFKFVENKQLLNVKLWKRFLSQFIEKADYDNGWIGEYWGKLMRGAAFVYSYSKNEELYEIMKNTILDMISSVDENGRISTYEVEKEFYGWDLWGRKYVLLCGQ